MIWVPTFNDLAFIRIWRSGENYYILTKRLTRKNDLTIGGLKFEKTRSLTAKEWHSFIDLINQSCFWITPSNIKEPLTTDGETFTLEGFSKGKYHLVDRSLPSRKMSEIFRTFFKLAEIKTETEDYQ